jgi:hypothetical protein
VSVKKYVTRTPTGFVADDMVVRANSTDRGVSWHNSVSEAIDGPKRLGFVPIAVVEISVDDNPPADAFEVGEVWRAPELPANPVDLYVPPAPTIGSIEVDADTQTRVAASFEKALRDPVARAAPPIDPPWRRMEICSDAFVDSLDRAVQALRAADDMLRELKDLEAQAETTSRGYVAVAWLLAAAQKDADDLEELASRLDRALDAARERSSARIVAEDEMLDEHNATVFEEELAHLDAETLRIRWFNGDLPTPEDNVTDATIEAFLEDDGNAAYQPNPHTEQYVYLTTKPKVRRG